MGLIDTHTHLNSEELYKDRRLLVQNALNFGVSKMIVVGYDLESSKLAVKIAHEFKGICYAAVGIHPSETIKAEYNTLNKLEELLKDECVVAVGEIGYDFHYNDVPELIQTDYFLRQIKLADTYKKPIIIHMRDATMKTIKLLKDNKRFLNHSGVIHCYGGSAENVKDFTDLGFFISFGGPLTFLNGKTAKEAILKVPLDKLLFETDAPYLAPHPFRGKTNEPVNITYVAKEASKILNMPLDQLINIESNNADILFNLCK